MMKKTMNKNLVIPFSIINFILVTVAFYGMNYIKRGTIELYPKYLNLLLLFYAVWICVSYLTRKFEVCHSLNYKHGFILISKSNLFILYILSMLIVLQGLYEFSRIQLFGTCLLLFVLEIAVFSLYYLTTGKKIIQNNSLEQYSAYISVEVAVVNKISVVQNVLLPP